MERGRGREKADKMNKEKIKVLNLYAGIGGNRKLWSNVKVVAVEWNKKIARIYKDNFPDDEVVVGDAHQFLLENFEEFDFIWSSPPCKTHSDIRRMGAKAKMYSPVYPDMKLYEEIIFLKHFCDCKWVVENVNPYYEPLIKPQQSGRHAFWANFMITNIKMPPLKIREIHEKEVRNMVDPKLGLHIFNCAFKNRQATLKKTV